MQTILKKSQLLPALIRIRKAIDSNSIMPVLSNVRFVNGKVYGTNLSITVIVPIEVTGDFLLPYHELHKIAALLTTDVTVTITEKSITLRSGSDVYKMGVPVDVKQFPQIPTIPDEPAFAAPADFMSHIKHAEECTVKTDVNEVVMNNVCIDCADDIWIMGVNRGCSYTASVDVSPSIRGKFLIDHKLVNAFAISGTPQVYVTESHLIAQTAEQTVAVRLSEMKQYHDLRKFLYKREPSYACHRGILIDAFSKCCVFQVANEAQPIVMNFSENGVHLSFSNPLLEQYAEAHLDGCSYAGPSLLVDGRNVLRILKMLPDREINLFFQAVDKPILLQDYDYNCVIMPLAVV